jgi:hypothetical protein
MLRIIRFFSTWWKTLSIHFCMFGCELLNLRAQYISASIGSVPGQPVLKETCRICVMYFNDYLIFF